GSWAGTATILASGPFSSFIQNTPRGLNLMWHPGNVGSSTSTSTSSGSPLPARVSGMNPFGGVEGRREELAVKLDVAGLVVHLVLVAAPLGNLDHGFKVVHASP